MSRHYCWPFALAVSALTVWADERVPSPRESAANQTSSAPTRPIVLSLAPFNQTAASQGAAGTTEPEDSDKDEDAIATDRPDFTESSSNIPVGRLQLESGYTFTRDHDKNIRLHTHSFPEILTRYGLTEDIELRLGWNYLVDHSRDLRAGTSQIDDGAADLYLGVGLALTKQDGCWPESKINLQGTAPTGADAFSSDKLNVGFNLLLGWDVNDCISIGTSTGVNTVTEEDDDLIQIHQSGTIGYSLTDKLGMFTELYGIFRTDSASNAPENYFDAGFTYQLSPDIQFDIRAGVGLNRHANDFFTGTGFAIRF